MLVLVGVLASLLSIQFHANAHKEAMRDSSNTGKLTHMETQMKLPYLPVSPQPGPECHSYVGSQPEDGRSLSLSLRVHRHSKILQFNGSMQFHL